MLFNTLFSLGGINLIVFISQVILSDPYFIHLLILSFDYVSACLCIDNDSEISTKINDIKN